MIIYDYMRAAFKPSLESLC